MTTRILIAPALGVALLSATAFTANAAMVNYKIANTSLNDLLAPFTVTIDSHSEQAAVGGIKIVKQGQSADAPTALPSTYTSICTDINGVLVLGKTYGYDVVPYEDPYQSGLSPVWGNPSTAANAAQAIQNAAYIFDKFLSTAPSSADTDANTQAWAALQLAIWETLYDTSAGFNLTSGRFKASGSGALQTAALSQAQSMLNDLAAHIPAAGTYEGFLLYPNPTTVNGVHPQGLLINPTLAPVPEPTTVVAGLLATLPLGLVCFRKLRPTVA